MVIPQRIPDSYVRSTVTASVQDRLLSISDQIMSRSRLERIITELDLYPEERRITTMEDVVVTMRARDIVLQPPGREQSFRVSYTSADPAIAQKVTARLASMFIEEKLVNAKSSPRTRAFSWSLSSRTPRSGSRSRRRNSRHIG